MGSPETLGSIDESTVWVIAIFVVLLVLFFGDLGTYAYDPAVSIRFMATFTIVSGLGFELETSRRRHYHRLLAEKISLEKALADVKVLYPELLDEPVH